jgi:hypothetical protein
MYKINTLESVTPLSGQYSFKKDMRLSAWVVVAALTHALTTYLYRHYPDIGTSGLMALRLTPLIPFGLWLRYLARFIQGLDELQRHLQLKVWLFAAMVTVVWETTVNVLNATGAQLDPVGVAGAICLMVFFWGVGTVISVRRYR